MIEKSPAAVAQAVGGAAAFALPDGDTSSSIPGWSCSCSGPGLAPRASLQCRRRSARRRLQSSVKESASTQTYGGTHERILNTRGICGEGWFVAGVLLVYVFEVPPPFERERQNADMWGDCMIGKKAHAATHTYCGGGICGRGGERFPRIYPHRNPREASLVWLDVIAGAACIAHAAMVMYQSETRYGIKSRSHPTPISPIRTCMAAEMTMGAQTGHVSPWKASWLVATRTAPPI